MVDVSESRAASGADRRGGATLPPRAEPVAGAGDGGVHATDGARASRGAAFWFVWSVVAAFGTYFCMYGFRKPFTAASFGDTAMWGIGFKTIVVTAQVLGYTISKFIGIRVIAEMSPSRRALFLLTLIGIAEVALVLFGLVPRPWNAVALFCNGLPLGMVFGLVLGFLEGRRVTEALTAGLCASFIVADGVTKAVGAWLLSRGVAEDWMPAVAGLVFLPGLLVGVAMLRRIPAPTGVDHAARSERTPLDRAGRASLFERYALGLVLLTASYLFLTIMRSLRADFAPEIWRGLGTPAAPATFAQSEAIVAAGVLVFSAAFVFVRDNRRAFFGSLAMCVGGLGLLAGALAARSGGVLGAFPFMVLVGLGMYLPYIAVHTTVFERLLAMTRDRGNIGYLMYIADAFGYLGYVVVMLGRGALGKSQDMPGLFTLVCWIGAGLSLLCFVGAWVYFRTLPRAGSGATGPGAPGA